MEPEVLKSPPNSQIPGLYDLAQRASHSKQSTLIENIVIVS